VHKLKVSIFRVFCTAGTAMIIMLTSACGDQQARELDKQNLRPKERSMGSGLVNSSRPLRRRQSVTEKQLKVSLKYIDGSMITVAEGIALTSLERMDGVGMVGAGLIVDEDLNVSKGFLRGRPIIGLLEHGGNWKTFIKVNTSNQCYDVKCFVSGTNVFLAYCERFGGARRGVMETDLVVHMFDRKFRNKRVQRLRFNSWAIAVWGYGEELESGGRITASGYYIPKWRPGKAGQKPVGYVATISPFVDAIRLHSIPESYGVRMAVRSDSGEYIVASDGRVDGGGGWEAKLLLGDSEFKAFRNIPGVGGDITRIQLLSLLDAGEILFAGQKSGGQFFGSQIVDGYGFVCKTIPAGSIAWEYRVNVINSQFNDIAALGTNFVCGLVSLENLHTAGVDKAKNWALQAGHGYRLVGLGFEDGREVLNVPLLATDMSSGRRGHIVVYEEGADMILCFYCSVVGGFSVFKDGKKTWMGERNAVRTVIARWKFKVS